MIQVEAGRSSCADEDADVQSCVDVLDRYLAELRRYMVKFPWPAGGDTFGLERVQEEDADEDEWEQLQTEVAALLCGFLFCVAVR